jgi:hypothetical protein
MNSLDMQAPGHPGFQPGFLEVRDYGLDRLNQGFLLIMVISMYHYPV